jgi:L-amino acid N-acyltransferase YncA
VRIEDAEATAAILNPTIAARRYTALDTPVTTGHGFRIVGTAERHAKIDGRYIDEIVIENLLP